MSAVLERLDHACRQRLLIAAVALLSLTHPALASRDFDYGLQARSIADGVFVIIGLSEDFSFSNGGNIVNTGFIIAPEGVIVIDTGSSRRYGEQMLAEIRKHTTLPILLTLNTHHHPDHFLGNQAFPGESLAAFATTIQGIRSEGEGFSANLYRLNGDWMAGTEVTVPTRLLNPGRLSLGGRDIELLELGGHTASDMVVIDHDSGTVFASDLIFNERAPTTPHADLDRWLESLDQLASIPARRWVPGHGPVADSLAPLEHTRDYLTWLQRTIREAAESGMDMTETFSITIPTEFTDFALLETEFRRSVTHLFPAAEAAALAR